MKDRIAVASGPPIGACRFVAAHDDFVRFVQSLIEKVASFDSSASGLNTKDVFRIYRDIRFSRDKTPYKTPFGAVLHGKGTQCGVAGYSLHPGPDNTFLAGGVHMPEPGHLKAIRSALSRSGTAFLKIIQDAKFRKLFTLEGERLVKVPQGFAENVTVEPANAVPVLPRNEHRRMIFKYHLCLGFSFRMLQSRFRKIWFADA